MTDINQLQCPLCLEPNACGNTEASTTSCWCFRETIPKELLEKVSKAVKGCQCICRKCIKNHSVKR